MQPILKVAIQGDPGSFHEAAAELYYTHPIELTYCTSFTEVFDLLADNAVDKAFVAVRNSAHGVIDEVSSITNTTKGLVTEGEYMLPIQQHLIGLPGATTDGIRTVISHPVALSQCANGISSLKNITTVPYYDTSAAVAYVKSLNNPTVAAIAGERAAALHGLNIIKSSIQDDPNNTTTFQSFSVIAKPQAAVSSAIA